MNVIHFNSPAEMQAYLIRAQADAAQAMHPTQQAITFGDYWARFIDIPNRLVEFGRVYLLSEAYQLELEAGATKAEAQQVFEVTKHQNRVGFMYGFAASFVLPNGESGLTHKSLVWPIEESLYNDAFEVNWHIDRLPLASKINLQAAFTAYRGRK